MCLEQAGFAAAIGMTSIGTVMQMTDVLHMPQMALMGRAVARANPGCAGGKTCARSRTYAVLRSRFGSPSSFVVFDAGSVSTSFSFLAI